METASGGPPTSTAPAATGSAATGATAVDPDTVGSPTRCSGGAGRPGRLKTRADFRRVGRGVRFDTPAFTLQAALGPDSSRPPRIGLTVTKKTGNAVERNRMKRRFRAAAAAARDGLRPGRDYVMVARRSALSVPFAVLVGDLSRALEVLNGRLDRLKARQSPTGVPAPNPTD